MSLARIERLALADLLEQTGPDRPTLCEGWDTRELSAHLLVRERRPDAAAGTLVKALAGHLKSVTKAFAARPWKEQVELLRSGPPGWNPMGWGKLDDLANGVEMFVHHEDVRRGIPGWKPRELNPTATAELTDVLDSAGMRLALRALKCGVIAELPDGRRIAMKKGEPSVTVHGAPGEIVLWATGRDAGQVELTGSDPVLAAIAGVRRGL